MSGIRFDKIFSTIRWKIKILIATKQHTFTLDTLCKDRPKNKKKQSIIIKIRESDPILTLCPTNHSQLSHAPLFSQVLLGTPQILEITVLKKQNEKIFNFFAQLCVIYQRVSLIVRFSFV